MNDSYILIGQYYGTGLLSKLIRWRTWSEISHTAAFLGEAVIEAWGGGVTRRPWTVGHARGTRIAIYRVPCTPAQRLIFVDFLQRQVGKPYDYTGIIGFALRVRAERKTSWFCSELVFAAAQEAGINLLSRINPYQVAPGDLNISPVLEPVEERICP